MPNVEEILRKLTHLEERRALWDIHWTEISEVAWPAADEFLTRRTRGEKRTQKVFDATAALALEKWAAILESLLTPRQLKWHGMKASLPELNDDPEVKTWFEEVVRVLFSVRSAPTAGFYAQKHEGYKSLGAFGNDCLFIEPRDVGGIRYKYCHIGQVYIDVDNHGQVDTIFRKFPMTAKAAFQKWGDIIGQKLMQHLEKSPFREFEFLHVVAPRLDVDPDRRDFAGMPWESVYIGMEEKNEIELGGFQEMPYTYSRYTTNPSEMYGRGPAMLVLPSIKVLNEQKKTFLKAGHRVVDPPLLLPHDGIMGGGSQKVRLTPGGLNFGGVNAQGKALIQPLITGARLDLNIDMMQMERDQQREAFFLDIFQILVDNPQMTATEVLERASEKGHLIAPAVGRQQSESLGPGIVREFAIVSRQGLIPPPPEVLIEAEGEYEIEYVSDATRFQRAGELAAADRTVERAIQIGETRVINGEKYVRLSQEVEGAPSEILRTPEEVEEIRAAEAEQAEQEAQLLQAREGAAALKDASAAGAALGPALSEAAPVA